MASKFIGEHHGDGSNLTNVNATTVDSIDGVNIAKRYKTTVTLVKGTYYRVARILGDNLSSAIRMTLNGTTGSVVVDVLADILVNHSEDIHVGTQSGAYTSVDIKIISTVNEDFDIYVMYNSGSGTTLPLYVEIFPLNSEDVLFSPAQAEFTGTTLVHTTGAGDVRYSQSSGNVDVYTDGNFFSAGNKVWHAGNDGSGSGLDADTLDGLHASSFLSASGKAADSQLLDGIDSTGFVKQLGISTTPNFLTPSSRRLDPNAANPTNAHYAVTTFGNGGNVTGQVATHFQTGEAYTRGYNNSWSAWRKQWDSANDGSGSGLDADLLDGVQGSGYLSNGLVNGKAQTLMINRVDSVSTGISWYDNAYNSWVEYMSPAGQTGAGPRGNLTAPSGSLVTSWAKRSHIENIAGYGWTFESASNSSTTPVVRFEIRSSDGSCRSAGSITAAGDVTAYSDARLKSDVVTIEGALDKVSAMRGVMYTKDDKASTGVIAQEVEAVLPEVVHTADDEMGTKSVAYGNMMGVMIEAIKELKEIVAKQQAEIEELRNGK